MSIIDKLRTTFLMADAEAGHDRYTPEFPAQIPTTLVPSLSPLANTLLTSGKVAWVYGKPSPEVESPGYDAVMNKLFLFTPSQYDNAAEYTNTLLHELVHWTGHPDRLGRDVREDDGTVGHYGWQTGVEEMTAQLGAVMLLESEGILTAELEEHSAQYIKGWALESWVEAPGMSGDLNDFVRTLVGAPADEATMRKAFDKAAQQAYDAVTYLKGLVA